jgi:predicted secreted protein
MATITGELGTIKVDTNDSAGSTTAIAEIRSWTLTHTQDTIEDTVMGDAARTYKRGLTHFSGSFDGVWDSGHYGTNGEVFDLDAGSSPAKGTLTAEFLTSTVAGSKQYSGEIIITSIERSASFDDLVTFTANFQGSGVLEESAVA